MKYHSRSLLFLRQKISCWPMTRRHKVVLTLVAAITVAAVLLDPTCIFLGVLKNDSFYHGRPTTYWSRRIEGVRPPPESSGVAALWHQILAAVLPARGKPPEAIAILER